MKQKPRNVDDTTDIDRPGVIRQSLMSFARGETGINLDVADKLAVYFGLELPPSTRIAAPKRKGK